MASTLDTHQPVSQDLPVLYIHPSRTSEWLPDIPSSLVKKLIDTGRVHPRLSQIVTQHYQLEPLPPFTGDIDHAIAMLDHGQLLEVVMAAGAIWHGRTLSRLIDKASLKAALSLFGERTYRLAVAEAEFDPSSEADQTPTELPPKEMLFEDGKLCFLTWLRCLPVSLSKRVELKFPPGMLTGSPSPAYATLGPDFVRKSGEAIIHAPE
jgi:hypothetical protein